MKTTFYLVRETPSIVEYPTINAEVKIKNHHEKFYVAIVGSRSYPIELGEWTFQDRTFNMRFRFDEIDNYVYGACEIKEVYS